MDFTWVEFVFIVVLGMVMYRTGVYHGRTAELLDRTEESIDTRATIYRFTFFHRGCCARQHEINYDVPVDDNLGAVERPQPVCAQTGLALWLQSEGAVL